MAVSGDTVYGLDGKNEADTTHEEDTTNVQCEATTRCAGLLSVLKLSVSGKRVDVSRKRRKCHEPCIPYIPGILGIPDAAKKSVKIYQCCKWVNI